MIGGSAGGHDDLVIARCVLHCRGFAQPNRYAYPGEVCFIEGKQRPELLTSRDVHHLTQLSAQGLSLLHEGYMMPPGGSTQSRFTSRRAAADDQNLLGSLSGGDGILKLPATNAVDQAGVGKTSLVAGHAGANLLGLGSQRFVGKVGIGNQRTAKAHKIRAAQCQQLFGGGGIGHSVAHHHGNGHHRTDALAQVRKSAPGQIAGELRDFRLMPAAGDVEQIHTCLLGQRGKGHGVLQRVGTRHKIIRAQP